MSSVKSVADWLHALPEIKSALPSFCGFFLLALLLFCFFNEMTIYQREKSGALCQAMFSLCRTCCFK